MAKKEAWIKDAKNPEPIKDVHKQLETPVNRRVPEKKQDLSGLKAVLKKLASK